MKRVRPVAYEPPVRHAPVLVVNGVKLSRGVEVTVDGIRGRCAVVAYVVGRSGARWVDIITSRGFSRSVRPEKIRVVHRNRKLAVL